MKNLTRLGRLVPVLALVGLTGGCSLAGGGGGLLPPMTEAIFGILGVVLAIGAMSWLSGWAKALSPDA